MRTGQLVLLAFVALSGVGLLFSRSQRLFGAYLILAACGLWLQRTPGLESAGFLAFLAGFALAVVHFVLYWRRRRGRAGRGP